jgi:acyl carrier protein
MDIIATVKQFVIESFLFGESDHLKDDTSFLESGTIDSTGILELVAFLEETFSIKIDDEEVVPENLDSLKNIKEFLQMKLQRQGS